MTVTRIKDLDPAAQWAPDADRAERLDETVERLLLAQPAPATIAARRRRGPARPVLALATAACAAGIVFACLPGSDDHPGTAAASAATILRDAAGSARAEQAAGPWSYTKTLRWGHEFFTRADGSRAVALVPISGEQWVADDGRQLTKSTSGDDLLFASEADRAAYAASGKHPFRFPQDGKMIERHVRSDEDQLDDIRGLPTDPKALAAWLAEQQAQHHVPVVHRVAMLLVNPMVTPELRAALYEALAAQPGARVEPGVTTPQGRSGVGVRFVQRGRMGMEDVTLAFDPETHDLLGIRQVAAETDVAGLPQAGWGLLLAAGRASTAPPVDLVEP